MKYDRPSGTTKSHRGSLSPRADGSAEAVKFQYFMRYNSPKQRTRHAAQMRFFARRTAAFAALSGAGRAFCFSSSSPASHVSPATSTSQTALLTPPTR